MNRPKKSHMRSNGRTGRRRQRFSTMGKQHGIVEDEGPGPAGRQEARAAGFSKPRQKSGKKPPESVRRRPREARKVGPALVLQQT